jgi:hypothetical protein
MEKFHFWCPVPVSVRGGDQIHQHIAKHVGTKCSNAVIATSFPSSQVKGKRTKMSSLACATCAMDWVGSPSETRPEAVVPSIMVWVHIAPPWLAVDGKEMTTHAVGVR